MSQIVETSKKQKYSSQSSNILLEIIEEQTSTDIYTSARLPYISSEFIPVSLIHLIMQHHFPSSDLLLSLSDTQGIYKIQVKDLLGDSVKNWAYNRPPDMARCPDIARSIYSSKKPIDTMFYLTYTNKMEIFEVLDGIHRLTSLKIIKEENSKPLELLWPGEFGSNNDATWLYNQYIPVNIRFNATLGDLIEAFTNLNKSQAVPELYIRDHQKEKRDIIDSIANEWYVKYKKHFSSSANPITGNTNRNKFVELLDKVYDKHKIDETTSKKLRKLLEDANIKIMGNIPTKATIDVRVKCKDSGCYLFLYKNDKLEEII